MGKSKRLTLDDVRRVFRLLGDCRDLGHDRAAWSYRAAVGLRDEFNLVHSLVIFHAAPAYPFRADGPRDLLKFGLNIWDVGWSPINDREAWLALFHTGRSASYPTVQGIYRARGKVVVRSRDQLISDPDWRRSAERNEDRRPVGQDETLLGIQWLGPRPGLHQVFSLNRSDGDRKFDGRERARLRLFLREAASLSGTALAVDEAGLFAGLTTRSRQVLNALLEGDAEKQIAARLGVSRHTVHDYVKALYRRFGVNSRGELLSAYHRSKRSSTDE